ACALPIYKEEPGVWVVRRGKPVRCPIDAGTDLRAFRSRDSARQYRAAGGVDSGGPIDLLYEGCRLQEFTVGPIENIEEAVTVCLQQKMADLAVVFKVHEHRRFICVIVIHGSRGELEMPFYFSGIGEIGRASCRIRGWRGVG